MNTPAAQQILSANRCAKNFGTNRATEIHVWTTPHRPLKKEAGKVSMRCLPCVVEFDRYHAESRTGIRASMAALKKWWHTYHYVPTVAVVAVADRDALYSCDNH